jgi:hypothetical protein
MAAAPFEKQVPDVVKRAPERVRKLTFRQAAVLTASIIALGLPGAICTMGSVRTPPPQTYSTEQAAVMSNTTKLVTENVCRASSSVDEPKPTMNAQNKAKE